MTKLLIAAGPGCAKTYTIKKVPMYLRTHNMKVFLENNQHTQEQLDIWQRAAEIDLPRKDHPDESMRRHPTIAYMAYNRDAVKEVKPGIPDFVDCLTIHGHGYSVLNTKYGYLRLTKTRGQSIVEKLTGRPFNQLKDKFQWLCSLRYLEKLKEELMDPTPENFRFLREKYDSLANFPEHGQLTTHITRLIREMKKVDRKIGIEYIDQIWMPLFLLKTPKYDLGLIDECQDLSRARLLLAKKLCRHLIFVGDENQAINAFSGADARAFDRIREECDEVFPLRESFRCPPNIVEQANILCPSAKLRTSNTENGQDIKIQYNKLVDHLPKDPTQALIICRYNAPLVGCALKLFKAGIPCRILGKQLPDQLASIVVNRRAVDIEDLQIKLEKYQEFCCKGTNEYIQEAIRDRIECINLVIENHPEASISDVPDLIKSYFKETPNSVTLSTIHKAKGAEKPNIFILFPPVESHFAKTEDQKKQERNLHFVAITRTSKNLYRVDR
jgi:hypothetical protein